MELSRRNFLQASALMAAAAPVGHTTPNDRITVGVIGTGAQAQELMESLQQHPQAEIVAVVDAYQGRLERAVQRTKGRAKIYKTHQDLLALKSIDAVVIATPDHLHKTIIMDALRAGKDVYCEKPMTYRSSEGPEIIAAARVGERMMQVGSQGVSSDVQRKAKEIIRAGKLGRITMIRAA